LALEFHFNTGHSVMIALPMIIENLFGIASGNIATAISK
jgi:hypothetical protein